MPDGLHFHWLLHRSLRGLTNTSKFAPKYFTNGLNGLSHLKEEEQVGSHLDGLYRCHKNKEIDRSSRAVFSRILNQFVEKNCEGDRQVRCQGFIYIFVFISRSGRMY